MGTRPYFVTYKGIRRLVEAGSPAVAAQHVVGSDIVELRPARASEVSAWYRDQRPVDVAGQTLTAGLEVDASAEADFTSADARDWLIEKLGGGPPNDRKAFNADSPEAGAIARFMAAEQTGALGLEDFTIIANQCAEFGAALAYGKCEGRPATSENIVEEFGDGEAIDFQDVITAIGEAKRRELFVDAPAQ
jgi:hypothetical protein